jgi:putative Holliday junction resolvase
VSAGEATHPRGRLLAVDYGDRRVGLALSDPLGMIASPLDAIVRRPGKRPPVAEIVRRAQAAEARGFVVGLPLDGAGDDTPRALEARTVAQQLALRTGLPAYLVDERYTTAAALRAIREMGGTTRGRKGDVDAMAAAVLLRHALSLSDDVLAAARVAVHSAGPDPVAEAMPPAMEHDVSGR